jgi:hypothetical protein
MVVERYSGHETKQAYAGYAKRPLERALTATRKRYVVGELGT